MSQETSPPPAWPRCPDCGKPRTTRCPVCGTTGVDFAEADAEYIWGMGLSEQPQGSCGCSTQGSCDSAACDASGEATGGSPPNEGDDTLVLMCPTCDEPFVPTYPNRCVWCGHAFDDGYEVDVAEQPTEEAAGRVILLSVGLAVLLALVAFYFAVVL